MNEGKEKKVVELNLDDILPNRFQPRIKFDEKAINELAGSIKEHGVIQPILVREIGDKYEIIAGERRYKASAIAGKEKIPAIINNLDDKKSAEVALIENIQRKDLTPIEEAISYKKILDMGYLNQEGLAVKLDRNQSTISNKLRLLNLDEEVQEALLNNKISERHARSLLKLENKHQQQEILQRIIKERLTVRKTDQEIDKILNPDGLNNTTRNEENFMKEEQSKSIFNIPSSPIIEEIEIFDEFDDDETIEPNIINDNINSEIENINFKPGFLDIDHIEQNAEEINIEKPLADLDSLLKVDEELVESETPAKKPEEVKMTHGKFFSFVEENNNTQTELEDTSQFNNFEFDVSNTLTPSSNENIESINQDNDENSLPKINYDETILDTDVDENAVDTKSNTTYDTNYNFNFDDFDTTLNEPSKIVDEINSEYLPDYTIPGVDDINLSSKVDKNTKSFNEVINEIRDYSKKIEEYGYFVEVDELDFGDSYQVIFKINKTE